MKLVHDADNVVALPVGSVAAGLRGLAAKIDAGEVSPDSMLIISRASGMVDFAALGENISIAEALGLLDLAHAKIVAGAWR